MFQEHTTVPRDPHVSHALQAHIDSIDLTMVKMKLMDTEEGRGWSQAQVDLQEIRYKRFLYLTFTNPSMPIVPTKDIDTFWHQHILDTRAYAKDCERVFGQFLHHFPYFGLRGEQDQKNLRNAFRRTCDLYEQMYGEPYHHLTSAAADCSGGDDGGGDEGGGDEGGGGGDDGGDSPSCGSGACSKCGSSYCSS